jgi:hypothetical protein
LADEALSFFTRQRAGCRTLCSAKTLCRSGRLEPLHLAFGLKGASPGTIPVEFVTRRELVFNLKTAGQLGVSIPEGLLSQAEVVR